MKKNLLQAIIPMVLVLAMVSCTPEAFQESTSGDSSTIETTTTETSTITTEETESEIIQEYTYAEDETALAKLINDHRESIGLNRLLIVNHISFKSEEHNNYMIENKVVNHDFFEERSQDLISTLGAVAVNENIAYNFATPNSVFNAWLGSDSHRENIEGDFTHFGISIRVDAETGKKYYTNMFVKI